MDGWWWMYIIVNIHTYLYKIIYTYQKDPKIVVMNRILFEISTVTISSSSRETLKTYLIGQVNLDRWESIPIIMFKSIKSFPFLWNQRVNHGLPHPVTFSARYLWLGRSGGSKKPIPSENKRKHNHHPPQNPNSSLKNKKNQHISNDRNFPQLFSRTPG